MLTAEESSGSAFNCFGEGNSGCVTASSSCTVNVCPALTASGSCGTATALIFGGGWSMTFCVDQSRREDSVVEHQPQQHAQAHLHADRSRRCR